MAEVENIFRRQISRMSEVEITSEFAQAMIRGNVGKTQKAIDNLYGPGGKWPERAEVERRFGIAWMRWTRVWALISRILHSQTAQHSIVFS